MVTRQKFLEMGIRPWRANSLTHDSVVSSPQRGPWLITNTSYQLPFRDRRGTHLLQNAHRRHPRRSRFAGWFYRHSSASLVVASLLCFHSGEWPDRPTQRGGLRPRVQPVRQGVSEWVTLFTLLKCTLWLNFEKAYNNASVCTACSLASPFHWRSVPWGVNTVLPERHNSGNIKLWEQNCHLTVRVCQRVIRPERRLSGTSHRKPPTNHMVMLRLQVRYAVLEFPLLPIIYRSFRSMNTRVFLCHVKYEKHCEEQDTSLEYAIHRIW